VDRLALEPLLAERDGDGAGGVDRHLRKGRGLIGDHAAREAAADRADGGGPGGERQRAHGGQGQGRGRARREGAEDEQAEGRDREDQFGDGESEVV
jgi:hypothetical protein